MKTFFITRHAHSCNNLKEAKDGITSVFDRSIEHDPGITLYGCLACLSKTATLQELNDKRYTSDIVYVSCLVRTWMTAILLYLPNVKQTLHLIISPFIKEKHILLASFGNAAASAITRFVKKSNPQVKSNYGVNKNKDSLYTIDGGNLPKDIGEQLIMLIHFFNQLSVVDESLNTSLVSNPNIKKIKNALERCKRKQIIIKIADTNFQVILRITQNLTINTQLMQSENIHSLNQPIGNYYYFYTKHNPGFFRNNPSDTVFAILQSYFKKTRSLDKENMKMYVKQIVELPLFKHGENTREIMDDADEDENEDDKKTPSMNGGSNSHYHHQITQYNQNGNKHHTIKHPHPIVKHQVNSFDYLTNNFLEKDISKFMKWVFTKQESPNRIHVITHSDCMQSFASRFLYTPKLNTEPNKYEKMADVPGIINLNSAKLSKKFQKKNKKQLKLKPQNSWDIVFKANDAHTITDIEAYYGVFQTKNTNAFVSSCERNCNYNLGIGDLSHHDKRETCKKRLTKKDGVITRISNFFRSVWNKKTSKQKHIDAHKKTMKK